MAEAARLCNHRQSGRQNGCATPFLGGALIWSL